MFLAQNKDRFSKACAAAFSAFILSLPFQTQILLYSTPWGRGFLNPYLSISFTVQDFFLITAGIFFILSKGFGRWKTGDKTFFVVGTLTLVVGILSLFFSPWSDPVLHGLMAIKALEAAILYGLATNRVLKQNQIFKLLIGVMSFEAALGIFQVLTQSSLGLHILGEPFLSKETPHLAKIAWGSFTWIRAYGTFPHPNILGGFLMVSILATLLYTPKKEREREVLLGLQLLGLLLTCSRSALLALSLSVVLLCLWYFKKMRVQKKKIFSILCVALIGELLFLLWSRGTWPWNDPAILSRWDGFKDALQLFIQYPLGVGWNHYTLFLDQVSTTSVQPWEYQPVHNLYLLALSETGFPGFILLAGAAFFGFKKMLELHKSLSTPILTFKKRIFSLIGLSILFIGFFDHYWTSLEQGRWLLVLMWGMFSYFITDPLYVFPIKRAARKK